MCGIVGFIDFSKRTGEGILRRMTDALSHRGPDQSGYSFYETEHASIGLGHRRLSILDLSSLARQPMAFEDLEIVYNGEVYNFRDIRKDLEKEGYKFTSNSDTEVVLKAFHRWGISAVQRFRGMFAFAIYDKKDQKLILCRDRLGVKPLYWYYKDGLFMFASELKAFHQNPNFERNLSLKALSLYLQYGYITSPYSIFENTYKLKPGHFLILDKKGDVEEITYWKVEDYFTDKIQKTSEEELAEELEEILKDSFKLRLISDVPVGVFLSGGIDSSTVTALLQKELSKPLKTFTIGFYEKDYNEANYAKEIAKCLGTEHMELYCTPKEAFEIIPKLSEIYDEPFGDSSAIPTYLVSKFARNHVKVALSADGGDEQFCGYTHYRRVKRFKTLINNIPRKALYHVLSKISPDKAMQVYNLFKPLLPKWTNFRDKYIKLLNVLKAKDISDLYDLSNKYLLPEEVKESGLNTIIEKQLSLRNNHQSLLDYMMLYDLKTYLIDDILVKVDRASMSVSLEAREPFLDHRIVEFTSRLPAEVKYKKGVSKYILRKVLYRYVPRNLIDRPKMGFGVPIYEWFKKDLKDMYLEYLEEQRIKRAGIFNHQYVKTLLDGYFNNKGVNHNKLWLLFVFELWRERWIA
ncbi:MAG: asparagine synthase (glutamine-hydrolyzing) [Aquificaceae bacterium]